MVVYDRLFRFVIGLLFLGAAVVSDCLADQARPAFPGICYGPYLADENPNRPNGPQPALDTMRADMLRVARLAPLIRTYSVAGDQANVPTIASSLGAKTWVGAWIGKDERLNAIEIKRLLTHLDQPGIAGVIVGNEVLLRRDVTKARLIKYIAQVRSALTLVPSHRHLLIAYADTVSDLIDAPDVARVVDVLMPNIHPYWLGTTASAGPSKVLTLYGQVRSAYPNRKVMIGEVGWPTQGKTVGQAVPGEAEQQTFLSGFLKLMQQHKEIAYFYFDAFDEPYKTFDGYWGVYDATGKTKRRLIGTIPAFGADPIRAAALARSVFRGPTVMSRGYLMNGYDMGVNTESGNTSWVSRGTGCLVCAYPADQWGAVFVTVGKPVDPTSTRPTVSLAKYRYLMVEMKGRRGGEAVSLGLKTPDDPDDGTEPKTQIRLSKNWKVYRIPLTRFANGDASRLTSIYVVCELVFEAGCPPETVSLRTIQFQR